MAHLGGAVVKGPELYFLFFVFSSSSPYLF